MSSITLQLEPDTEQTLRERAERAGQTLETFLQHLAEREARNGTSIPPRKPTLDEILAPVRQGFTESGMTDEELDDLFKEAREEAWKEKQSQKN